MDIRVGEEEDEEEKGETEKAGGIRFRASSLYCLPFPSLCWSFCLLHPLSFPLSSPPVKSLICAVALTGDIIA